MRGPKTIVGIDPGLYGAFAAIRRCANGAHLIEVCDTPRNQGHLDPTGMSELVFSYAEPDTEFYIERQQPFGCDSRRASFTTGQRYGYWIAALMIARARYCIIAPRTWQQRFGIWNSSAASTKEASLILAKSYFPGIDFAGKDGRSDATLIGVYGCLKYQ